MLWSLHSVMTERNLTIPFEIKGDWLRAGFENLSDTRLPAWEIGMSNAWLSEPRKWIHHGATGLVPGVSVAHMNCADVP